MNISTIVMNIDHFDKKRFSSTQLGVEVQTFPQHVLDEDNEVFIKAWQNKLQGFSGVISLHGSSFDLNPGSTDKKIVEITRYRYMQSIDIARKLNAKYVVFHSQVNPLLTVKRIRKLKLENQIRFWNELLDEVPNDICILLENEYDESYEEILKICDEIIHPNIGVCLDIGHALAYSKISLEEWISNLGQRIKYIHLHWNDGKKDNHDTPSDEQVEFLGGLLYKYQLSPVITMEYHSEDVHIETRRLKRLLSSQKDDESSLR